MSHSARSAWIETLDYAFLGGIQESHSARSAWIETLDFLLDSLSDDVALRKECVD